MNTIKKVYSKLEKLINNRDYYLHWHFKIRIDGKVIFVQTRSSPSTSNSWDYLRIEYRESKNDYGSTVVLYNGYQESKHPKYSKFLFKAFKHLHQKHAIKSIR